HEEAVGHRGALLDDAVELPGAEADTAAVEGRVRASCDDTAAALGEPDPVALPPDSGEHVEVRAAVERAVRVPPEADRHRGHRLRDHALSELADERSPIRVERVRVDAEQASRDLALVDGKERRAADDTAADVGAAAAVHERHVRAELLVHVPVSLD